MKKTLNKNKLFYFIIVLLMVSIIGVVGVRIYKDFFYKPTEEPTVKKTELDSISLYGYTLDDYDTAVYKEEFENLKNILKEKDINYEDYAKSITKLFIIDFYTLNTKLTSSDIGGQEFIHSDMLANFNEHALNTIYSTVKTNVYKDRVQDLPIVKEVTINNIEESTYTYNEKEYQGYKVAASWIYESDMGYETNKTYYLIKDNNKLNIVEGTNN